MYSQGLIKVDITPAERISCEDRLRLLDSVRRLAAEAPKLAGDHTARLRRSPNGRRNLKGEITGQEAELHGNWTLELARQVLAMAQIHSPYIYVFFARGPSICK